MQKVTVANIDQSFHGVFQFDAAKSPHKLAAFAALRQLKQHHGFFEDNTLVTELPPAYEPLAPGLVGILMLEEDAQDKWNVAAALEDENTYFVHVEDYEPGRMWSDAQ